MGRGEVKNGGWSEVHTDVHTPHSFSGKEHSIQKMAVLPRSEGMILSLQHKIEPFGYFCLLSWKSLGPQSIWAKKGYLQIHKTYKSKQANKSLKQALLKRKYLSGVACSSGITLCFVKWLLFLNFFFKNWKPFFSCNIFWSCVSLSSPSSHPRQPNFLSFFLSLLKNKTKQTAKLQEIYTPTHKP